MSNQDLIISRPTPPEADDALRFYASGGTGQLPSRSALVWRRLSDNRELVLTFHGQPVVVLSGAVPEALLESLMAMGRKRAMQSLGSSN